MLRTLIIVGAAIAGFGFILYQLGTFLFSVGGSRSKMDKDTEDLKDLASQWDDKLVPLDASELSLMAHNVISEKVKTAIYYTETGVINSVYEESLLAYSYRRYDERKAILVAFTKESEFVFVQRGETINLVLNNYNQGTIDATGRLLSLDGKELGVLELPSLAGNHRILMEGEEVASLIDLNEEYAETTKLFNKVKPLEEKQHNILTALTIYDILMR